MFFTFVEANFESVRSMRKGGGKKGKASAGAGASGASMLAMYEKLRQERESAVTRNRAQQTREKRHALVLAENARREEERRQCIARRSWRPLERGWHEQQCHAQEEALSPAPFGACRLFERSHDAVKYEAWQ